MSEPLFEAFDVPVPTPETHPEPEPVKPVNPCLALYGPGPEGQTCKDCVHLRYPLRQRTLHWKCDLRELSHSRATDHKVKWPACGRYERREGEYHGG